MREWLKLATFNLLNLRLPHEPIYGRPGYSEAHYERKIAWIAATLDRIAPDVVMFQEVFSEAALLAACARSQRFAKNAWIAAPWATPGNLLPRVGYASVLPLMGEAESITDIPPDLHITLPGQLRSSIAGPSHTRFSRPLVHLKVNLRDHDEVPLPMHVIGLHLKSRRPELLEGEDSDDPRDALRGELRALMMRGAEAAAVRALVVDITQANRWPTVVMGDFNDALEAVTTELVAGPAPSHDRSKRDTMLMSAHGLQGHRGFRRDVAYSHVHQSDPQVLDHILLSEEFHRDSRYAIGEVVKVDYYNDHLNDRDPLTSDHAVVATSIRLFKAITPSA